MTDKKHTAHGGARNGGGRPVAPRGAAVRRLREAAPYTQEELSHLLGCSINAVRKMEYENRLPAKGEVFRKFKQLCQAEGVELQTAEELTAQEVAN